MTEFKLKQGTYYTDTDSIFTETPLDNDLIGTDLGLMSDELVKKNTNIIEEVYFFGVKKYGYYYKNLKDSKIVSVSVFAGVERNSITFDC